MKVFQPILNLIICLERKDEKNERTKNDILRGRTK